MNELPSKWQPENSLELGDAIAELEARLPGWWWRVGACHVSADASIGPDQTGPDAALLTIREFDAGFHVDLPQPASCADALRAATRLALAAKERLRTKGE